MTATVVEVGPATVRARRIANQNLVSTALESIDDELAVVDDQPVEVDAVWRALFRDMLPERMDTAVLVCPSWWASPRIDRVREAAATRAAKVVVLHRCEVLSRDVPGTPWVVEIASEFVVLSQSDSIVSAEPRTGEPADIAKALSRRTGKSTPVLLDAPTDVAGAVECARGISQFLRRDGIVVTTVHPERVLTAARDNRPPRPREQKHATRSGRRVPWLAALAASVMLPASIGLASGTDGSSATSEPTTLLVEGRVSLKVPGRWSMRRITTGPGSARVEVVAPDNSTALLMTQSPVRRGEALPAISAALRRALDDQPDGIFSLFNPDDRRADRSVATYREVRDGRQIDWSVFVDDSVRIAIGCQSVPGGEHTVRGVCDEAIRSAHQIL